MWNRQELKSDSKLLLKLNYWPFVLVAFIHTMVAGGYSGGNSYNATKNITDERMHMNGWSAHDLRILLIALGTVLVTISVMMVLAIVLDIFVFNPVEVGCKRYMTMAREVKPQYSEMVFVFKNCYGNVVKTMFLMDLYTALWSLLLVIPGIIKSYEYRMIPYLLAEHPDMETSEAFRISREMMTGNKWDAFVLDLSFIGWGILSVFTLGIVGIFYVQPYQMLVNSGLYLRLKSVHPAFGHQQPCM